MNVEKILLALTGVAYALVGGLEIYRARRGRRGGNATQAAEVLGFLYIGVGAVAFFTITLV